MPNTKNKVYYYNDNNLNKILRKHYDCDNICANNNRFILKLLIVNIQRFPIAAYNIYIKFDINVICL